MNPELSEAAQRVEWLLKKVWKSSQSRMASETGISQSAISNVVTGRQQPGRKMLEKVSSSSLVNSTWLVTGHGDPLVTMSADAGRRAAYLARSLFDGLPEEHGDCLGNMLEVPLPYYRPSRYWIRVADDCPLMNIESLRLSVGDVVLFEPDSQFWPEDVTGHPCIVKDKDELRMSAVVRASAKRIWPMQSETDHKKVDGKYERDLILPGEESRSLPSTSETSYPIKSVVAVGVFRMGAFGQPVSGA